MNKGNKYLEERNHWEVPRYFDKAVQTRFGGSNALRDKGYALGDLEGTRTGSDVNELSALSEDITEEIAGGSVAILDLT